MYKICLVIPSLQPGGMERVMSELAGYFAKKQETKVDLVLYGKNRSLFYPIPENISIHKPDFEFDNGRRTRSTLKTLLFLRKKISDIEPNVVLSFGEYWNSFVLISLLGKNYPVFVSDRCSPEKDLGKMHEFLRRCLYPNAAGVIAQTTEARKIYKRKKLNNRIPVIGNPIRAITKDDSYERENIVLSVGRLIDSKHHDRLINIFSKIRNDRWKLIIVGGDALKQNGMSRLNTLIEELEVEDRVELTGNVKNVDHYYKKSKIFAFTSSSEGFPNVIGEAISAGLPVISYNCTAGPRDMICDGKNGYLVTLFEDDEFGEKLQGLMDNEKLRMQMSNASTDILKKYSRENIGADYFKQLKETDLFKVRSSFLYIGRKIVRFTRFVVHSIYYFSRKRIGNFERPDVLLNEIGYFDKKNKVHAKREYRKYFRKENLYEGGDYNKYKSGTITLIYDGKEVLIKKSFSGFRKFEKFYNEIICEDILRSENVKPSIKYVDYKELRVYIRYIDGLVLSSRRHNDINILEMENREQYISSILNGMEKIHEKGIIQYDVGGRNIIANGNKCWFIDFADSIYFRKKSWLYGIMKKEEQLKLKQTLSVLNKATTQRN